MSENSQTEAIECRPFRIEWRPYVFDGEAYRQFEALSAIGCTIEEICGVVGCSLRQFHEQRTKEILELTEEKSPLCIAIRAGSARLRKDIRQALVDRALTAKSGPALAILAKSILEPSEAKLATDKEQDLDSVSDEDILSALNTLRKTKRKQVHNATDDGD